MHWGRCSPTSLQSRPSWQEHLVPPETLNLTAESHGIRACRHACSPCATIRRSPDRLSARLHVDGSSAAMIRINDRWVEADDEYVELVAGDVIEFVCLHHAAVRTDGGWYAAACVQRADGNLVAPIWRFVPQDCHSLQMCSPSDVAKSFFPRTPFLEANPEAPATCCSESDDTAQDAVLEEEDQPPRKRGCTHKAVHLKLSGAPSFRTESDPLPLLPETEGYSWW